jgi:beta-glucosidase
MVLAQMTLDEEIALVHGTFPGFYGGLLAANPRLCIPALPMINGPAGVNRAGSTQLPAAVAAAATWDGRALQSYGSLIGEEAKGKGADVLYGPSADVVRDPRWGRAFEAFGEDPYLASRSAIAHIRGVQSQGVMAQVKHFAAYTQETDRNSLSGDAIVDERTLREIYLLSFERVIRQAGVASVMCSYARINDVFACSEHGLLTDILKGEWGFNGWVGADWLGTHSTVQDANAGLDWELPQALYFGDPLKSAVQQGSVPKARLDDMVRRILRQTFRFGLFDRAPTGSPNATVTTPAHAAFARTIAEQGSVLLKNAAGLLPLNPAGIHSIAVLGPGATNPMTSGKGSSEVPAPYVVRPVDAIARRAGSGVTVRTAADATVQSAVQAAAASDIAVVFGDKSAGEGRDFGTLILPPEQNDMITQVAAANPRTIVVLNTHGAMTMPWIDQVEGVLEAWYGGQEMANAVAAILFGDVNPSGKLPVTFPKRLSDLPTYAQQQWTGTNGRTLYSEGLRVGYRHYDAKGIQPLFPFGFGLSYTTFGFGPLTLQPTPGTTAGHYTATVTITNTGSRAGADVVQLYVGQPAAAGEPPKQLRRFRKVTLGPGGSEQVSFHLGVRALSHWDTATHRWIAPAGTYTFMVGDSSRNLPSTGSVTLSQALSAGT